MIVINGILMASDRYGAIGVDIKHVVTFVLNSSNALEFNSMNKIKKIRNQNRITLPTVAPQLSFILNLPSSMIRLQWLPRVHLHFHSSSGFRPMA